MARPITNDNRQDARNLWLSDPSAATKAYGPIGTWDTSRVTTMAHMWCAQGYGNDMCIEGGKRGGKYFNEDISLWDMSSVTTMYGKHETPFEPAPHTTRTVVVAQQCPALSLPL